MTIARTTYARYRRPIAIAILVVMVLPPFSQTSRLYANGPADPGVIDAVATEQVHLLVGRSAVIRTDRPITRVSLSTPEIADAMVTSPRELLVHGKTPGTISLLVWSDNGRITTYEVAVRRDLSPLEGQIRTQFPTEPIRVASNGRDVVLSGVVSTKYVIDRASSLAVGYVEKPENVVNLLRQQESMATTQVMLQVRFAEVSRSAMQELGASFFTGPNGKGDWIGRGTTQQYPAPDFDKEKGLVFSDFLNLFAFNTEEQLGATIRALKGKGLFQSLAEPNLITQDGKEASFLAGGEYPYPVVQGGGANSSVTIMFKEFGVRLRFTPTITAGDYIQLKVAPEVSALDFSNAIILEGFRVPALSTRRTETEVELRDGQTFAIAGLLDRSLNETLRRVPGIGDIPILGYLFRSQAYQKNNTELVVMITPHIVRRDSPGVSPTLPGLVEPFMDPVNRTLPQPPPAFTTPTSQPQQVQPSRDVVRVEPAPVARPAEPPAAAATAVTTPLTNRQRQEIEKARKAEEKRLAQEQAAAARDRKREQELAQVEEKRLKAAAKIEARRAEQERVRAARAQEVEQKLAAKRAEEQAVIDRKRWLEQQEQAAEARQIAEKLAREQARRDAEQMKIDAARREEEERVAEKHRKAEEKLAREQAERDDDLKKLLTQYKKLTGGQP